MNSKMFIVVLVLGNTVEADESTTISCKVGDHLKIPGGIETPVHHILWKHNNNFKVVEWDNVFNVSVYGDFKNRTTLDIVTGDISIRDLRLSDSGIYHFAFNNSDTPQKTFRISVIEPVFPLKILISILVSVLLVTVIIVPVSTHKCISGVWFYETGFWRQQGNSVDLESPGIRSEPQAKPGVVENGEGPKEEENLMT